MEVLIEEILKAKGFTVCHSKTGPDGGKDLLASGGELFANYEKLSPAIRAEIPLKQIWMLSKEE